MNGTVGSCYELYLCRNYVGVCVLIPIYPDVLSLCLSLSISPSLSVHVCVGLAADSAIHATRPRAAHHACCRSIAVNWMSCLVSMWYALVMQMQSVAVDVIGIWMRL